MTQEEKQLLLVDLCARLPYRVKFKWCDGYHDDDGYYTFIGINEQYIVGRSTDGYWFIIDKDDVKPYLRPMSSMTEEEKHNYFMTYTSINGVDIPHPYKTQDWLNANHFDFRGLIKKDLAIEVTEDNNPYKD